MNPPIIKGGQGRSSECVEFSGMTTFWLFVLVVVAITATGLVKGGG